MWNFQNISRLLTLLALAFLILMLLRADLWQLQHLFHRTTFVHLTWATLALALGWLPLAWIWARQVRRLANPPILSQSAHFTIFATTQIQKYLPGNVFQYLLRHMEARRRGESDIPLFWAWVAELLGQTMAALILALLCLGWLLTGEDHLLILSLILLASLGIFLGLRLLRHIMPWIVEFLSKKIGRDATPILEELERSDARITPLFLLKSSPAYLLNITITGLVTCGLTATITSLELPDLTYIIGWSALAWFIGFALPGAPGGIGPREATLTAALQKLLPLEGALFIAFSLRLAAVLADFLFYLLGLFSNRVLYSDQEGSTP